MSRRPRTLLPLALLAVLAMSTAAPADDAAKKGAEEAAEARRKATEEAAAKKKAAEERKKVEEGLAKAREFAEVGRRVAALEKELREAPPGEADWFQSAILCVELGDLADRRGVAPLVVALGDRRMFVQAVALHGLDRLPPVELKKGGGAPLVEATIDLLKGKLPYHRRAARSVLAKVAGEDLGPSQEKWRSWLRRHEGALPVEPQPFPFDEAAHDPKLVADIRAASVGSGTNVRPRIPSITTELREMNKGGLDVALCLDQTGSMGAVIAEAKARIEDLTTIVTLVVKDSRFGLVTFDDGVRVNQPLSPGGGRVREVLGPVQAAGGGDGPEGVDKALEACARPDFGWRKKATKTIVVLGDAPPHDPDVQRTFDLVKVLKDKLGITTSCVSTGGSTVPTFPEIAERGGGRSLPMGEPSRLVGEILLLVFGEPLRPAMERFVPVMLDVTADEPEPAKR